MRNGCVAKGVRGQLIMHDMGTNEFQPEVALPGAAVTPWRWLVAFSLAFVAIVAGAPRGPVGLGPSA